MQVILAAFDKPTGYSLEIKDPIIGGNRVSRSKESRMPTGFGERLASLRRSRNLSQEELAERIGLTRQAISNWERSESVPDTANLVALASLYEISLDELVDPDGTIPDAPAIVRAEARPTRQSAVIAFVATAVLAVVYYLLLANPLMSSTVNDIMDIFGLGISPTLVVMLFVAEVVTVAVPLMALALVQGFSRRSFPFAWLAPIVVFVVIAGAPAMTSLMFGIPIREYTGIGGYTTSSVVVKADVLGLVFGFACVALAQRRARLTGAHGA